ncbi:MAG TPA: sigma 54-interacting transcriptional regulator [Ktedonobacteraceae bacterium]|nr:sigma 54-interacting transcriptional regulator [Ktedonobacteraceae bacterium]
MLRKDRVFESLRSLCAEQSVQQSAWRQRTGFSAEEVAELAHIDRTNASRDLNRLVLEGRVERIAGRPVLFMPKTASQARPQESTGTQLTRHEMESRDAPPHQPKRTSAATHVQSSIPHVTREAGRLPSVSASVQVGAIVTSFETLIGGEEGLKVAIQQAKAAMLYPPRGLHTLLCGPSGVGKTTFARLMHAFAIELGALPAHAPFISFNCADYAGNPQLLMAHLFGVVRGAYTGAERDRVGLVEQANHGILFLDEVHRLPPEGQEMLFYLMDRERFRRLGEVQERTSSLLLLAATTEDPAIALLPTFRRRIPMSIILPGLHERTHLERYALLRAFFTTECSSIGANIQVDPQVLRALLFYECPGNIGQLRTDVQLTCARAYLEYRTGNLMELRVHPGVLPDHVRRGLLRTAELRRDSETVLPLLESTHVFTPTGLSLDYASASVQDLYETIGKDLSQMRRSGLPEHEINRLLHLNIQHYFQHFANEVGAVRPDTPAELVDERIARVCAQIASYAEERLARTFPDKLSLVLAMHLTSTLEHLKQQRPLPPLAIQSVRRTYPLEYEVARETLLQFRSALGVTLPESETDVLTVLLANAETLLGNEQSTVGIVVATYGRHIAEGLAELANTLVGVNFVRWVELTLEQSPEELLTQVIHWVRIADQGGGVLLLVDFPSLLSLEEMITRQTDVEVRTIAGVSAPLLIEAVQRAQRSRQITLDLLSGSLRTLARDERSGENAVRTVRATTSEGIGVREKAAYYETSFTVEYAARVILSVCLTGFGSAAKIAELLHEHLPGLDEQGIEIICMDISLSSKTEADIQHLVGKRQVVAVVGTINPHLDHYPFIALTDFLFGDGVARLRTLLGNTLIDPALLHPIVPDRQSEAHLASVQSPHTFIPARRADLMQEISFTLSQRLLFLNPARVMPLIEKMIELIEVEVGETFEIDVLSGLILHLACILERDTQPKGMLVNETMRQQVAQLFARELSICRNALHILSTQLARTLPDEEAYNIVGILRQVDIFAVDGEHESL